MTKKDILQINVLITFTLFIKKVTGDKNQY